MADLKTKENDANVEAFLQNVEDEKKREDSFKVLALIEDVTGQKAKMWGASIVGCGSYRYKYATGREGDWMMIGFSPRKANLTLYIAGGFEPHTSLMEKLGKHKTGKGCLYINKLADVNENVLKQLLKDSMLYVKEQHPPQ